MEKMKLEDLLSGDIFSSGGKLYMIVRREIAHTLFLLNVKSGTFTPLTEEVIEKINDSGFSFKNITKERHTYVLFKIKNVNYFSLLQAVKMIKEISGQGLKESKDNLEKAIQQSRENKDLFIEFFFKSKMKEEEIKSLIQFSMESAFSVEFNKEEQ